jgi:hypothetical protein
MLMSLALVFSVTGGLPVAPVAVVSSVVMPA